MKSPTPVYVVSGQGYVCTECAREGKGSDIPAHWMHRDVPVAYCMDHLPDDAEEVDEPDDDDFGGDVLR